METLRGLIFGGCKVTADGDCGHEIKRHFLFRRKTMTNLDSILKSRDHYFANKGLSSQICGLSNNHIQMWELDRKENWALKNWSLWTVVLERTFEHPLYCKGIQPVNPKGNQSWILIGRTDAKAECSILWPPDAKSQLIRKDTDAGKDSRWEEKGTTENNMVGWHHRPNRYEFKQVLRVSER